MNISDNNTVYNTYNLTVIGLCDTENFADFVKYFKDEIYHSFKDHADFYNLDSLGKAEADPNQLKKTSKITFKLSDDISKTFLGFSADKSIEERYKQLFGTPISRFDPMQFFAPLPSYTNELLVQVIKEKFGAVNLCEEPFLNDISVSFESQADSKVFVEVRCSVSPSFDLPFDVAARFSDIIEKADLHFTEELCSAYISYAPERMSITHTSICFRYDRQKASEYIFGGEWYVYMSKRIKDKLDPEIVKRISKYAVVNEHQNGMSYKADCEVTEFDKYRSYYHSTLNNLIIPAYGEISWDELTNGSARYGVLPTKAYVFNTPLADRFGPDIVFAHNCSVEDVCRYDVKTPNDLTFTFDTSKE